MRQRRQYDPWYRLDLALAAVARVGHTDVTTSLSRVLREGGDGAARKHACGRSWRETGPRKASEAPRSATSWGSPTGSLTTGRALTCCDPRSATPRGAGRRRVYAYTDLLQLKVIKQLLDAGVSLRHTRKAIECLRGLGRPAWPVPASSSPTTSSVLAHSGEELFDLLPGGPGSA